MYIVRTIEKARSAVREFRADGKTTGLVPTMGALHEGHRSLIRAARARCDAVAVTIFVNPTQFGPDEDLDAYPSTLDADLRACSREGVDLVFTPGDSEMYTPDHATTIRIGGLTEGLCGIRRPGHFDGVATVVAKLFHILPADMAFFGEKDYQQLLVVKRLVRDLNIPIEIVGCPIVREPDGLAMSSRNQYLSPKQRAQAVLINKALSLGQEQARNGETDCNALCVSIRDTVTSAGPSAIEYVDVVDAETLQSLQRVDRPARICVAVRIGSCRLIDNVAVDPPQGR